MIDTKPNSITDEFVETICQRLSANIQVRRSLPVWGRVSIDRQLPFLCIYRKRNSEQDTLSDGLITGEASYLIAAENRKQNKQLAFLVKSIAGTLKQHFGSFLIVEVWVSPMEKPIEPKPDYDGTFKIIRPKRTEISSTIESFEKSLKKIKIRKKDSEVSIEVSKVTPPGLPPLLNQAEAIKLGIHFIGIEVKPVYLSDETDNIYPLVFRKLKRGFSRALKNAFFEFTRNNTPFRPPHYQSLGRHSMVKAVWDADSHLAEIGNSFDFLLQLTPVNTEKAWLDFKRKKYQLAPKFVYRPLSIDPSITKRRLFQIYLERIEDPTLALLFRDRQLELDRKLTMLIDRQTQRFLYGSIQLYGAVSQTLLQTAEELLNEISPRSRDESSGTLITATEFSIRAEQKLNEFAKLYPEYRSKVFLKDDITGLMVSHGNLLVGKQLKIRENRVEALIAHEVETHILTYLNGKSQRIHQLYLGFPGYDELQEGLAVLSEYLVGGLTGTRLRLLAARVVAAHRLEHGASFIEVFNSLNKDYGFAGKTAFNITTRTFRSGGLTKDAVYLRGLIKLLEYFKKGGELEPLFIGKIAAEHLALVKELQWRKILHPPKLRPAYLNDPDSIQRLNDLKNGLTVLNLIKRRKK